MRKGGQVGNLRSNTYHDANLAKMGPVVPEFFLLKGLFEKEEIDASRIYSPRSMHAARAI